FFGVPDAVFDRMFDDIRSLHDRHESIHDTLVHICRTYHNEKFIVAIIILVMIHTADNATDLHKSKLRSIAESAKLLSRVHQIVINRKNPRFLNDKVASGHLASLFLALDGLAPIWKEIEKEENEKIRAEREQSD